VASSLWVNIRIRWHKAIALLHGDLQALFQTTLVCLGDNHLIDHHLDAVHLLTIQLHPMEDLFQLAIDTDVQISFFTYLLEKFLIVPLTITDQVIDKMIVSKADERRLKESLKIAMKQGDGLVLILDAETNETFRYPFLRICSKSSL